MNAGNLLFPQCIRQHLPYAFLVCAKERTSQQKREWAWYRYYSMLLGLWYEGRPGGGCMKCQEDKRSAIS